MSNQLLSIGGWYFLPNLATSWLQTLYYRTTTRAGDPIPQPGHPLHAKHRRNIFIVVVISYLLYTIYEADWQLQGQGDFYRDLGVPLNVDEKRLQSRFRRLTVQYHPDKLSNPSPKQLQLAEAYYVHLKIARDTLLDPAKRFAYERFGPDMLEWKQCVTQLDFIKAGLQRMLPYYVFSGFMLVFVSFVGYIEYGKYWQYFCIAAMFVFEAHTITRPYFPIVITRLIDPVSYHIARHAPYLPYQAIVVARKIAVSMFIAVAQIAPQFRRAAAARESPEAQAQQVGHLLGAIDNDAKRLLELEIVPYVNDTELEARLKGQLKTWLVQNEIRNDPGVDAAIRRVLDRRRMGEEDLE